MNMPTSPPNNGHDMHAYKALLIVPAVHVSKLGCHCVQPTVLTRRPTVVEGLYSGLGSGAALTATQLDIKMKLLVEAPAAVEDALASLLDHHDATLQVLLWMAARTVGQGKAVGRSTRSWLCLVSH